MRRLKSLLVLLVFVLADLSSATEKMTKVIFLGDSLTEGYGVDRADAYPSIVDKKLKGEGITNIQIINSSISGSTSASAHSRLKWQLKEKPHVLVLALGANDGLRGLKIEETRKNLSKAIELAQENQMTVILAGQKIPPNYGKKYTTDFENIYKELSQKYKVALIPFLLEGVGGEEKMNQSDGIHPNEAGHEKIATTVLPYLKKALKK